MDKNITEEDFPIKKEEEKVEEVKTEEPKMKVEVKEEKKLPPKGTPFRVYRNEGDKLFLVDSAGNGIKIPTPEKYKNVKKDDIVYL